MFVQSCSHLIFSSLISYISFSFFTLPRISCRIFLSSLHRLPCHFYLVAIEQQRQQFGWKRIMKVFPWFYFCMFVIFLVNICYSYNNICYYCLLFFPIKMEGAIERLTEMWGVPFYAKSRGDYMVLSFHDRNGGSYTHSIQLFERYSNNCVNSVRLSGLIASQ